MLKTSVFLVLIITTCAHASQSLYKEALKKNIQLLEKKHSVTDVKAMLTSLAPSVQVDIVFYLLLASKVYTIEQREEILQWFLDSYKKNISTTDYSDLMFIKEKYLQPLKILHKGPRLSYLVAGPNAQLCDKKSTLLMKAASIGKLSLVRKLIELGANPNAQDDLGLTALFFALNIDTADLLIKAGANVHHVDKNGSNILFYEDNPKIIKLLVSKGVSLDHLNTFDKNAIAFHAVSNDTDAIKELVHAGAKINQLNNAGLTALDQALDDSKIEQATLEFLIANGAKTANELLEEGN